MALDQELSLFPGETEVRKAKAGDRAWRGRVRAVTPEVGPPSPAAPLTPTKRSPGAGAPVC